MENKVGISARLTKAMNIRGMKQSDLVEQTGIGKSSLSQYIAGKYEPKADKIYLLAKALNVSEAWLMGYDVPMERDGLQPKKDIKKSEEIFSLTDHEKLLIQAYRNQVTMQAAVDRILNVPSDANHDALINDMANTINTVSEVSIRNQSNRLLKK
ncbi:MAG TPA: helix-turn-helix domain-containing protein [Caproiciproducens sp.]|nr:helix-turn-helix domain-containing protein [Caproiciproducens sp.]